MTESETIRAYQSLRNDEQVRLLARLAHSFTLRARSTYVAGTSDVADPAQLRGINEVLHRITGQLGHLLESESARYPDDVFAEMLCAGTREFGCEADLARLLQTAGTKPIKRTA